MEQRYEAIVAEICRGKSEQPLSADESALFRSEVTSLRDQVEDMKRVIQEHLSKAQKQQAVIDELTKLL